MAPTRMPKEGCLRRYLLLSEGKKVVLVAGACFALFFVYQMVFTPPPKVITREVPHTLSQSEIDKIKRTVEAQKNAQIDEMRREWEAADREKGDLEAERNQLQAEKATLESELKAIDAQQASGESEDVAAAKAAAEEAQARLDNANSRMKELEDELEAVAKSVVPPEKQKELYEEFDRKYSAILGAELERAQESLIQNGIATLLASFCDFPAEKSAMSEHPRLGEHPCVGIASASEKILPLSSFGIVSGEKAMGVAHRVYSILNSREAGVPPALASMRQSESNLFCGAAYDRRNILTVASDAWSLKYMVHPVFGAFFHTAVPTCGKTPAGALPNVTLTQVCFHQRWDPDVEIRPMTPASEVGHLLDPVELLPLSPDAKAQAAADAKAEGDVAASPAASGRRLAAAAARIVYVLPYRKEFAGRLPQLLQDMSVRTSLAAKNAGVLVVAAEDLEDGDKDYAKKVVELAKEHLKLDAAFVVPDAVPSDPAAVADEMPKYRDSAIADLTRKIRDQAAAKKAAIAKLVGSSSSSSSGGVVPTPLPEFTAFYGSPKAKEAPGFGLLKAGLTRVLLATLRSSHVAAVDTIVFLDTAMKTVNPRLARFSRWRVITGRVIYAPAVYVDSTSTDLDGPPSIESLGDPAAWGAASSSSGRRLRAARRLGLDDDAGGEAPDSGDGLESNAHQAFLDDEPDDENDEVMDESYMLDVGRIAVVATTKSDIATLLSQAMKLKIPQDDDGATLYDSCVWTRLLYLATQGPYRIARSKAENSVVAQTGSMYELTGTCECDEVGQYDQCQLQLPQSSPDTDEGELSADNKRVNCAVGELLSRKIGVVKGEVATEESQDDDGITSIMYGSVKVPNTIKVHHSLKFIDPARRLEIVAKVVQNETAIALAAAKAAKAKSSSRLLASKLYGPEVFSFQWKWENKVTLECEAMGGLCDARDD